MRTLKGGLVLLMVVAMVVTTGPLAFAGRSGTQAPDDDPPITVDSKADGKIVEAIVGLNYTEVLGNPAGCEGFQGPTVNMTISMKVDIDKKNSVPLGAVKFNLCYWDFVQQDAALHDTIREEVVPHLYQVGFTPFEDSCFAIKSVEWVVDDKDGDFTDPNKPNFSLMKLKIAIDTKTPCPAP